jgi:hypothetical protein
MTVMRAPAARFEALRRRFSSGTEAAQERALAAERAASASAAELGDAAAEAQRVRRQLERRLEDEGADRDRLAEKLRRTQARLADAESASEVEAEAEVSSGMRSPHGSSQISTAGSSSPVAAVGMAAEISGLKQLLDEGVLTEDEFTGAKMRAFCHCPSPISFIWRISVFTSTSR